jgi:hypothetical protein
MRLTARRRAALAVLAVALPSLALLGPVLAQAQDLPETEEIDLDTANCFGHHAAETPPFRTTVLMVPAPLAEVPANQEFDLPIQVQVAWKQEMTSLKIGLNLSRAPNLAFLGEREPFILDQPGQVNFQESVTIPFTIDDLNATEAVITLDGDPGPLGANDLDLRVISPGAVRVFNKTIEDEAQSGPLGGANVADEQVRLTQPEILDGGLGEWLAEVRFSGTRQTTQIGRAPLPAAFNLHVEVHYNASRSVETFVPIGRTLVAGEITNVTFRLRATAPGPAMVALRSLGNAHYIHTDAQATDDGNFSKTDWMAFDVGSAYRLRAATAGLVDVGFDPATKLMRQWGFLLGWLGFFLVPPSLVLGGTFGGRTVRALNARVGSARQRVLWHNALSYVLLAVGLTHMTLFLLEVTYPWTLGVVWGGLTLAAMIGLAVTGALQTRIAKAYGYATWRFTHFLMGMLVVAFVLLHVVVDGVDFQFLRDYFLTR